MEEVLTVSAEAPARTTRAVRFPVRLEPRRTRAGGNARKHAWGAAAAMTRARYCPRKQKRTTRILRPDNQEITRDEYLLRRFEQTSRRHPARGSVSRPPPIGAHRVGRAFARSRAMACPDSPASPAPCSPVPPRGCRRDVTHTKTANLRADKKGDAFLNQYLLIRTLGRGAFGTVKLCLDTDTHELCALKCIHRRRLRRKYAGQGGDGGKVAVRKEIAILTKTHHANVVRLLEVVDDAQSEYVFMALEYVPGGPLYDPCKHDSKGMGETLARKYFRQTLVGVHYLHANGVVHRDLKPDNLLKQADGTVKICDFGVSEAFSGDDTTRLVTGRVGTPAFLAPELVNGGLKGVVGEPTDVWSLGVTLCLIATGTVPFPGNSVGSVVGKIAGGGDAGDGDVGDGVGDGAGDGVGDDDAEIAGNTSTSGKTEKENQESIKWADSVLQSVTPRFLDLLKKILNKNPATRYTLREIATHDWITQHGEEPLDFDVGERPYRVVIASRESVETVPVVATTSLGEFLSASTTFQKIAKTKTFKQGDFLLKQGDTGDSTFVILEGEVEVLNSSYDSPKKRSKRNAEGNGLDELFEDENCFDFFDDIVAAAMMNRDARDGDGEFGDDVGSVSKQSSRKSGWFGCCFGSFASASDKANQPKVSVVATRRAGDVVGEMALLVPDVRGTRSCSVRATSPEVLTSVISKTHLWSHLRLQNPEVLESSTYWAFHQIPPTVCPYKTDTFR